jgi:hypothetical protein
MATMAGLVSGRIALPFALFVDKVAENMMESTKGANMSRVNRLAGLSILAEQVEADAC